MSVFQEKKVTRVISWRADVVRESDGKRQRENERGNKATHAAHTVLNPNAPFLSFT